MEIVAMQLWTHHPEGLDIASPELIIDPTKGKYWNHKTIGPRYQKYLPKIWKALRKDRFLWCCTAIDFLWKPHEQNIIRELYT